MKKTRALKERMWDFLLDGMWLDGLRLFFTYWQSWFFGFAFFSMAFIGLHVVAERFPQPYLWDAVHIVGDALLAYFFMVCFLWQEPVTGKIRVGWGRCVLVVGYVSLIIAALAAIDVLARWPGVTALAVIGKGVGFWLAVRLLCVVPLAVNDVRPPLITSWKLTSRKEIRLMANIVMLAVMLTPVDFLLAETGLPRYGDIFQVFAAGAFCAFACTACRILYGEHIAARVGYERRAARRG